MERTESSFVCKSCGRIHWEPKYAACYSCRHLALARREVATAASIVIVCALAVITLIAVLIARRWS